MESSNFYVSTWKLLFLKFGLNNLEHTVICIYDLIFWFMFVIKTNCGNKPLPCLLKIM